MTANKPEVVAWRWRKPIVNDHGKTVGVTDWKLGEAPNFLPWWTNEPLVRLSDYEQLQERVKELEAESDRLKTLGDKLYVKLMKWLPNILDNPETFRTLRDWENEIFHSRKKDGEI